MNVNMRIMKNREHPAEQMIMMLIICIMTLRIIYLKVIA